MATFTVRFLRCDVSPVVPEEVRERPVAEGGEERRGSVSALCSVTRDAVAKLALEPARSASGRSVRAEASRGSAVDLGEERVARVAA